MRVFVTGATGTVGREVCRTLLDRGAGVRIGVRNPNRVLPVLSEASDVRALDFEEPTISEALFDGIDSLFLMTPFIEDQVAASRRVLQAALDAGVRHVVRLSSRSADWDRRSVLRAWHREIDQAVRDSGATWTILRPCSFFQNFMRYQAETIRNMSAVIIPQGDGLIAYVDALDLGEAAAQCLLRPEDHGGQTYVLTGARAYGAKGIAAEIGRVIGRPVTYIDIDEEQAQSMMLQQGMPAWLVEAGLAVFAHAKAGGEAAVDPALARIIGRPASSLSEFVQRNREAWLH
ncbi:MAG: SDR family oxidoreductase [Polyangiales bacterium]